MAFLVSPGVEVKEIDLTNVVPAVSTSIGATAGAFAWGPVSEVVTVGSEKELATIFGKPNDNTYKYFMPAAQFLQYANALRVVRTNNTGQLNAAAGGVGILVKNKDDFETKTFAADSDGEGFEFVAKYPGALGNAIKVLVVTSTTAFNSVGFNDYADKFNSAPGTSTYAAALGKTTAADEIHVVVVDATGAWTGTENTILEIYEGLSQASDAKRDDGTTNYYLDYINSASKYVWAARSDDELTDAGKKVSEVTTSFTTSNTVSEYQLDDGSDGTSALASAGELATAFDFYSDAETIDVNLIIGADVAGTDAVSHANAVIAVASGRKDAIAFVSPAISKTVNNSTAAVDVKTWADSVTSSSYGVMDSTALYVYDKYNDKYRWIIAAGAVAGLCAYTDNVSDPWFSPAGFTRGVLRGVTKLALNPKQAERDDLYKSRVNPIVSFPGEGIVLYGDKTAQAKPSAFDRINVRRLFIVLEKAVATASKFSLFEFNDEFTRAQFRNLVEPFLRDVQGRRGINDFRVICDETNNTGDIIDTNRFVADIYIKPARSINFITLNFIATRTGVEFTELAGQ